MVHGRHRGIGAVLAVVLLCTAFPLGQAQAKPSAETIARGKALAEAADCASCHTADPLKALRRRQAHRHPIRGDLFA
jgi:mono/diheme cytochrome c family protein